MQNACNFERYNIENIWNYIGWVINSWSNMYRYIVAYVDHSLSWEFKVLIHMFFELLYLTNNKKKPLTLNDTKISKVIKNTKSGFSDSVTI